MNGAISVLFYGKSKLPIRIVARGIAVVISAHAFIRQGIDSMPPERGWSLTGLASLISAGNK